MNKEILLCNFFFTHNIKKYYSILNIEPKGDTEHWTRWANKRNYPSVIISKLIHKQKITCTGTCIVINEAKDGMEHSTKTWQNSKLQRWKQNTICCCRVFDKNETTSHVIAVDSKLSLEHKLIRCKKHKHKKRQKQNKNVSVTLCSSQSNISDDPVIRKT
jgi:hypothetical protein